MPVMTNSVIIRRPIELVFDYVTTPAWWPIYHPLSRKVEPYMTHSFGVGETLVETCEAGSLGLIEFAIAWDATENDHRTRFAIVGHAAELGGADARITYDFSDEADGVRFLRTLEYEYDGVIGKAYRQQAEHQRAQAEALRPAVRVATPEMTLLANPIEQVIDHLVANDSVQALEKVKLILEHPPC